MIQKTFRIARVVLAALVVVVVPLAASPGTAESSGAGPDCSGWRTTAFWRAAAAEDAERCLAVGAKIDARNKNGTTPLHKAAWSGSAATVNALIAAGAKIEARDGRGMTPLHLAAGNRRAKAITVLLDAGVDGAARTNLVRSLAHGRHSFPVAGKGCLAAAARRPVQVSGTGEKGRSLAPREMGHIRLCAVSKGD